MTQRDNILQELRELQSLLANASAQNIYRVPAGYFEGLADQVLRRIKALEAMDASEELGHLSSLLNNNSKGILYTVPAGYFEGLTEQVLRRIKALETDNATEELDHLSPLLSGISKEMPYAVPQGYFENMTETSVDLMKAGDENAAEELATLSPLLSGLKKEMPYSVPQDYFQNLGETKNTEIAKPQTKVISISITKQKWFRYAAAAMVIGFVAITGFLLINRNTSGNSEPAVIVKKMMKNVSPEEIEQFVETVDEGSQAMAQIDINKSNEIKELIKDIPDEEIQKFLEETQINATEENGDDLFMN
ncbi:MAG TPA: hypothetical protein VIZ28_14925 [Chitinophagaceae bacterium]